MVDLELLNKVIDESGLKLGAICKSLGLTYQGLKNKLNGVRPFKVSEANALSDALHLSTEQREEIFFAHDVENKSTNECGGDTT